MPSSASPAIAPTTPPNGPPPRVLVMGTGSVGGFVGGSLQAVGVPVQFVARPRMAQALREQGLQLSDLTGRQLKLPAAELQVLDAPPADSPPPELVLLAVKSGATTEAAAQLATVLPPGTPVLSLQNGIGNAALGAQAAPGLSWLPGMVPYNIAELGPGRLHRGTGGQLAAQDHPVLRRLQPACQQAGLGLKLHADLAPVQWGKLLLNLNNPVNAMSGLPLRAELLDAGYRRLFAALQLEALQVLRAAGIQPAQVAALAPQRLPRVMQLPNWLFTRLAARMLNIDEKARSSMADDLALGRSTEIDALCGEVCRLAARHHVAAPLNARMLALVEAWPQRRRPWPAAELRRAVMAGT